MTDGVLWPVDAVSGAPLYAARAGRQASLAPLLAGGSSARPFGILSGVRPGTRPTTVEATSTTWTVHPHAGAVDAQVAAEAGPYAYAIPADVTGAVNPAHGTFPRWDVISVKIDDPAESDGSSVPAVTLVYTAGTAASSPAEPGQPGQPSLPSRSMILARIVVPQSGGGSPSVVWRAPTLVAPGGIVPVFSQAQLDAANAIATATNPLIIDDSGALRRSVGSGWTPLAGAPWQSYTPVLTASSGGLNLGNGSALGHYCLSGKTVVGQFAITFGSSGVNAGSGNYQVTLPLPVDTSIINTSLEVLGQVVLFDSSGSTEVVRDLRGTGAMGRGSAIVTSVAPWTWSTSDAILGTFCYPAA